MDDFLAMEYSNTIDYLLQDADGFILWNRALLINLILERAWVTELNNHDFEIFVLIAFVAFKNVWMVESHHDLWLLVSKPSTYFSDMVILLYLNGPQIENLNSNLFVVFLINSPVDICKGPFTNFF